MALSSSPESCFVKKNRTYFGKKGASEGRRTEHSQNSEWETEEVQEGLSKWHSFLSLVLIEIPFLVLRVYAFVNNSVPIGILALKNIHNIYYDLSKIFPRLSINESGEGNVLSAFLRVGC